MGGTTILKLSLGLVTHKKSMHYRQNVINEEFYKLQNSLDYVQNIIIEDNNCYEELESFEKKITYLLKNIIVYLKNLTSRQIYIYKIVGNSYIKDFLYNILQGIYFTTIIIKDFIKYKIKISTEYEKNILRQSNISASHVKILKRICESGTEYGLIVEDDIFNQVSNVSEAIKNIIKIIDSSADIKICNISKSFTSEELKIESIIKNKVKLRCNNQEFLVLTFPVMNTLCAVIYRVNSILFIHQELEKLINYKIIPIDEKMNIALMRLIENKRFSLDCYAFLKPGILTQGSLHEQ